MARAGDKRLWLAALISAAVLAWAPAAHAGPKDIRVVRAPGKIVPIPASIPHEAGDMIDQRIIPDLKWIAARFPIYITDGYSGPRPGGGPKVGCMCHTHGSDHYNGLAVDIVPVGGTARCDAKWNPITRLALWAEPRQNHPVAPFRWVGYNGDAGHGCGNHLHLSWDHSPAPEFRLASTVTVFGAPIKAPPGPAHPPRRGGVSGDTLPAPPPSGGVTVGGPED